MTNDIMEITKEILEECQIPKPKLGITKTFKDVDEYYEDENYVGWNGMCVEKNPSKKSPITNIKTEEDN